LTPIFEALAFLAFQFSYNLRVFNRPGYSGSLRLHQSELLPWSHRRRNDKFPSKKRVAG
jgi:hypothetical protein